MYLWQEVAGALLEEWADLLQVGASANVLELRAVLHVGNEGAGSLALDCRATLLGQLLARFGIEGAHSSRLKQNSKNKKSHTMKEKNFHLVQNFTQKWRKTIMLKLVFKTSIL